jgi:excisionase family DNA binding protein
MPTLDILKLPIIAEESSLRTNPPKLLNVTEASTYIGVSQRTLRSWISERKIKVARLGGRVVLRLVDVDRFIERHLEGGLV